MATIGKIRERSGLVIVLIGVAMLGFIATDLLQNNRMLFTDNPNQLGEIWGEEVSPFLYGERVQNAINNQRQQMQAGESITPAMEGQIQDQIWEQLVMEQILAKEANELGLQVSGDEIMHLSVGPNPHPIAVQFLTDQQTGKIDKNQIYQFISTISQNQNPEAKKFWSEFESYLTQQRLQEKYTGLVRSAMFATDLEAADDFMAKNRSVDFSYVPLFTNSIPDSTISVSDSEIETYYNQHKENYKQEKTRGVQYVVYPITPGKEDTAAALEWVNRQIEAFRKTQSDSNFVVRVGNNTFSNQYQPRGTYPEAFEDEIFAADSGAILGPYYDDGAYKLVKVLGSKTDSLTYYRASHILIRPKGATEADSTDAYEEAQEIYNQVRGGTDFAQLAREKSQDVSNASKGGDLGWFSEGRMVKKFEEAVKRTPVGGYALVKTEFGTHVIKVTEAPTRKTVKAGILVREVSAGGATEDRAYSAAAKFRGMANDEESFMEAAKEMGIDPRVMEKVTPNERVLPTIENARELVRWMYNPDTKQGDVSSPMRLGDKYVVAVLTKVNDEEYTPLNEVKEDVKIATLQEKKKDMLKEKLEKAMEGKNSLEEIAKAAESAVSNIQGASFSNTYLQNLANEPKLVGFVTGLKPEVIAGPVKGEGGVYVVKVTKVDDINLPEDFSNQRTALQRQIQAPASDRATAALKKAAEVKDNRYLYY